MKIILSVYLALATVQVHVFAQGAQIKCLANMGVEIIGENKRITIDAFFHREFDYLGVLDSTLLYSYAKNEPPYDNIDVVLATHLHGDHYNASLSLNNLQASKNTFLLTTREALDNTEFHPRALGISPSIGADTVLSLNNVHVQIIGTTHFGKAPWNSAINNAYLITTGKKTIFHLGDGALTKENLMPLQSRDSLDLAIIHFSQLVEPSQMTLLKRYLQPRKVLAAHIPPQSFDKIQVFLTELYGEEIIIFEENKIITLD